MKKGLTVAIATHNEAANIERCLASVYDIADEIIIVDGKSTDGTVEVAKKNDPEGKIRISLTENLENFHIMKQMAIDAASYEWIFQIDADEAVSQELAGEVAATTQKQDSVDGYWMPRLNYFLGKPMHKGGQYPDKTIRLYRNGKGRLPCKSLHEQAEITGTIGELKHDLLHFPYPTFQVYIDKWGRYALQEAKKQHAEGTRPSLAGFLNYCIVKPHAWFFKTYFRHKGFQDGLPGFIFSLFSGLRFCVEYAMLFEMTQEK